MRSLVELLRSAAADDPGRVVYSFVRAGSQVERVLTFAEFDVRARTIAAHLQEQAPPNSRVLLNYPPGLGVLEALFGCAYAGMIAVPGPVPRRGSALERVASMARDADPVVALTDSSARERVVATMAEHPALAALTCIASDELASTDADGWVAPAAKRDDPVLIQYTSGSTSDAKGVVVSHGNLLANTEDVDIGWEHDRESVMVTWLPLFHDMGLIYCGLQPIARRFRGVMMSPAEFVRNPVTWLEAISHFRGTHTASPNFGYQLCVDKVTDQQVATLDLSSLRCAANGAEPVRYDTVTRFAQKLAPAGFRPEAHCPSYGMAEHTLKISTSPVTRPPRTTWVDTHALEQGHVRVVPETRGRGIVGCGVPGPGTDVSIVDPASRTPCDDAAIGEIWVRGPLKAHGYWGTHAADATTEAFAAYTTSGDGPYLRTGDLGFVRDGEIHVAGRLRDLIIIRGANHHPSDVEFTVQQAHTALEPSRGAAFSIDSANGEELVVVHEMSRMGQRTDPDEVFSRIVEAVSLEHGLVPAAIVLLGPHRLPVTSSGKVRRRSTRQAFQDDALRVIARWDRPQAPTGDDVTAAMDGPMGDPLTWLIHCAARVLAVRPEDLPTGEPLARFGFDSLSAELLAGQIAQRFGREFSPAIFFEHPSLREVRDYLTAAPDERDRAAVPETSPEQVAIVGMACRLPGAPDLAAFWRLLEDGRCAIGEVPAERESLVEFFSSSAGTDVPSRGGYLTSIDTFDADLFRISPAEAATIDPQHRLLLEVCWEALESTGSSPLSWDGRSVGVFVGISTTDYMTLMRRDSAHPETHWTTGTASSVAANRLSYYFNWQGPSLAVDTACSSSLVALHSAVRSLRSGECELAIVGGVNVMLDPQVTAAFADAGMLAPDGLCKTFDATADGYVRAEGCGVVVLQRFADARRDGRRVSALICGSAVNQDGRSNGITAPNARAQVAVLRMALKDAGVQPAAISLVEAHGTGTQLGDPVEVRAVYEALRLEAPTGRRPALGSVKTNIGHLEAAAGVAGLIKAALALRHRTIPAHLHWRSPNEHMGGRDEAFEIPTVSRSWDSDDGSPRFAGVSSFGFGGTNAHVVLSEAPEAPSPEDRDSLGPRLLTLSGHTDEARRAVAGRWRAFLAENVDLSASRIERHCQLARPHLRYRLALVASTVEAMTIGLEDWLAGRPSNVREGICPNRLDDLAEAAAREAIVALAKLDPAAGRDAEVLARLTDSYLGGASPPWSELHPGAPAVIGDFPAYPFQRKRHWFKTGQSTRTTVARSGSDAQGDPGAVTAQLTEIVAALLLIEPADVDCEQHFLEMGADSIMMTRAMRAVQDAFGVRIAVSQLFEELPTLNAVARYLADRASQSSGPSRPASDPVDGSLASTLARQERALVEMSERWRELRRSLDAGGQGWTEVPAGASPPSRRDSALPPWRPSLDARANGSGRRKDHIDELVRTLGAATSGSKAWTSKHRPHLADNRAVAGFRPSVKELVYPILGDRADGAWVWDADGNRYLDLTMGFGVNLFGHAPARVTAALRAQLGTGYALGPQHALAGEVARMVTEMTGTERVAFCNTGTEAVMTALRLARASTGRTKVAIFEGSYHGHFDGVLARGREHGGRIHAEPLAPGITSSQVADLLPLGYGSERSLAILRAEAPKLAAILVEPVQSRHPALQPVAFLRELREIATASGAVLVFDETITGFRIAAGGAQEYFGVRADVGTYGKILGGGMPIGAVAGSRRVLDALDGGQWSYGDDSYPAAETTFFAGTFNKHPLALAASRATLEAILAGGAELYESLNERTSRLAAELDRVFVEEQAAIRVEHFGSLFRFAFDDNQDVFIYHLLARGLYIWEGRNCFLSTAHGDSEVDQIVGAVRETLRVMRDGGFLASTTAAPAPASQPRAVSSAPIASPGSDSPGSDSSFPLTPGQSQLCLLARINETASAAYNEAAVLRFAEPLHPDRLRDAIERVVERHAALRTVLDADKAQQRTLEHAAPPVKVVQAGQSPDLTSLVAVPFAFSAGPPVRFALAVDAEGVRELLVCAHHSVIDGWSLSLVVDEIGAHYRGEQPTAPAAGFEAFAKRASQLLEGREARRHEAHWRERLLPLPAPLDLRGDHGRPATRSFRGAAVQARLDGDASAAARRFCVEHRLTPSVLLLGTYLLLLHRSSGQDDLVVGMPVSGRPARGDENVVGFCAQMTPVRSRYRPERSVASWLTELRDAMLADAEHTALPTARVLDLLGLPFDASRAPLFGATFNLDVVHGLDRAFGCDAELIEPSVSTAKFDLSLNVTQLQGEFLLRLEFATDLFEPATVEETMRTYLLILRQITTDADQALAELETRSDDERRRLALVNDTARAVAHPSIVPWFFERAARSAGRTAVVDGDGEHSFADVATRIGSIARALTERDVAVEEPVGVCLGPGMDLPCALLGVMLANASYVPLEPTHPPERLHAIREGVGARRIVTSRAHQALWDGQPVELVLVEDVVVAESEAIGLPQIRPDQAAYVIHTSGSTGRPKGVTVTHGALVNFLASMEREPGLTENDVLLSLTPISFDIAALEQFLPLVAGATLVPAPAEVRSDGQALGELIERCSATVVQATPSTLELLLDGGWRPDSRLKLLCGGEALSARLAGRLTAAAGSLWNMYGPTETTIWSSVRRVMGEDVDIGSPIDNTWMYVTDEALSPSPAGVAGELWIGGGGLARGYHGQPALTAERFVPDPFSATPGQRMYRTGDRVRRREDRLEFLGRTDDQMKVRGVRVEPAEIEATLCDIPRVMRAAVCQVGDAGGERVLVAYIVVDGDAPSAETLRGELSRRLPAAMIPQRFERLDRMPTTPSGKLDRPRLVARRLAPLAGRGPTARGEVELVLAAIWADVLGVSEPGIEQNFFDLGGTSLAMGRVHVRAQERFGRSFPLIDFLQYPTIRDLAGSLGDPVGGGGATHADDARRRAQTRKRRLASIT